jgi:hypothetical protein
MRVSDDLNFKLCVAGIAAVALFTGTASFAQDHHTGMKLPPNARMLTDPAEIAAVLAKCGIKLNGPGGRVAVPQASGQNPAAVRAIACDLSKEMKAANGAKAK